MGAELGNRHQERRRTVVVMVAYPLQGHVNPMLHLATMLHSKGLSVTFAHPSEFKPPNNNPYPNCTEITYLPLKAANGGLSLVGPALTTVDGLGGIMDLTVALNKGYKDPFEQSIKELMGLKGEFKIGCIIYDVFMYFAQGVADRWNIPGISLSTSCAATVLTMVAMHCSCELGYNILVKGTREYSLEETELQALELDNVLNQQKETTSRELFEVSAAATTALSKSSAIIVNTLGFLERAAIDKAQMYFSPSIYPIGPFHKYDNYTSKPNNSLFREDPTCMGWLDQHPPKSVIYVSFGSLASMTEEDLIETAMGLSQTDLPFLWVVRPGSIHERRDWAEILPQTLLERVKAKGCIVGWAPQRQVLGHGSVGGFWTHCGWNSTIESLCEGVPMICRPFFGDQFWNAKYISKVWKIGLELEDKLERGNIERVLRELMVGKEGEIMRKRALDLKENIDLCIKEGGSSHKYVNQLLVDLIISF